MDAVLVNVLEKQAAGRITPADTASAVKLAGLLGMKKEALLVPPAVRNALGRLTLSPATQQAITTGLASSLGIGLAGLGVHGVASGARAINERLSKKKDLERILEVFPRLKEYPPNEIELAYNSIRHMNPHIAKDPLAGGSLLGQVLRQRDNLDPKTMRMETDLAGNLLRLRPEERHTGEEIMRDAMSVGMGIGFNEASKLRSAQHQQSWQAAQNDAQIAQRRDELAEAKAERVRKERGEEAKELDAYFRRQQDLKLKRQELGMKARQFYASRRDRADDRHEKKLDREANDRRVFAQAILRDAVNQEYLDPVTGQKTPPTIGDVLHLYPNLRRHMP